MNLNEQQRNYIIAALKFVRYALLKDDELTEAIHLSIDDYYEQVNNGNYENEFDATINLLEDLATINEIFDTLNTDNIPAARPALDALIEALETNGTPAASPNLEAIIEALEAETEGANA